jgi:hypothetical protein
MREGRHEMAARIHSELFTRIGELVGPNSTARVEQRIAACHLLGGLAGLKGFTSASQIDVSKCLQLLHQELGSRREAEAAEEAALTIAKIVCSAGLSASELIEAELSRSLNGMQGNFEKGCNKSFRQRLLSLRK